MTAIFSIHSWYVSSAPLLSKFSPLFLNQFPSQSPNPTSPPLLPHLKLHVESTPDTELSVPTTGPERDVFLHLYTSAAVPASSSNSLRPPGAILTVAISLLTIARQRRTNSASTFGATQILIRCLYRSHRIHNHPSLSRLSASIRTSSRSVRIGSCSAGPFDEKPERSILFETSCIHLYRTKPTREDEYHVESRAKA